MFLIHWMPEAENEYYDNLNTGLAAITTENEVPAEQKTPEEEGGSEE